MSKSIDENPREALWDQLDDARFVMLGSPKHEEHMQPMSPQVERDTETIWFYADQTSDLVQAVRSSDPAALVHMSYSDSDFQTCVRGSLTEYKDRAKIDQHWSPFVSAWFADGKDDPNLTMLCFTPHHAALWQSDANAVTFAFEMAKALLGKERPDLGDRASVSF